VSKNRKDNWLTWIILAVGLIPLGIGGLWVFMTTTATSLHPNPTETPSVTRSDQSPAWMGAIERGRQIIRTGLTEQNLPGLSVAVGVGGDLVWAEGFGWADLDKRVPIAPETRLRIGTASIVLTSAAIGLLVDKGQLNLDDVIQKHVPEFPEKQWPVTLRQIMGHVAGIRSDSGDEGPLFSEHCEKPVEALPHFANKSLLFEPGTQYQFSNYGGILMSAAVEASAHEPFFTFMRKQIFEPLGMADTMAESATEPIANRATFYFPRFAADPTYGLHLMRELDYSCYAGSSAFLSTPSDLVRFATAINEGKLLKPPTIQMLQTQQRLSSGQQTGYGLGWDVETVALEGQQLRAVGHDGDSLGGMVASLMTFPDRGIVVSVISNISYADTFSLASQVAQAFVKPGQSPPRK
jgi:CubicO group peptidase (beta-lactamase class C family)